MGIVLTLVIGLVLVTAVATVSFRIYRNSRRPPTHEQHPKRRKRKPRPKRRRG
jgi:hypothetical protein